MKKIMLVLGLITVSASSLYANIRFYPRVMYVDSDAKYKSVYIENSSEEDNVYKLFTGYTAQDENGKFYKVKDENKTEIDKKKDYCKNLKIFPRRLTIKSGMKQVFRIIVKRPKEAVENGEYYCRAYARAQPVPIEIKNAGNKLGAKISTVLTLGAPIHIRVGKSEELNIKFTELSASIKEGVFSLKNVITNDTNLGLRGEINIELSSRDMEPIKIIRQFTIQGSKLNFEYHKHFPSLKKGESYRVRLFVNDSEDVSAEYKLFGEDRLINDFQIEYN